MQIDIYSLLQLPPFSVNIEEFQRAGIRMPDTRQKNKNTSYGKHSGSVNGSGGWVLFFLM